MSVLVQRLGLSSTGNRATWTFSAWVKKSRSVSNGDEFIFSSNTERTGGGQYSSIYFGNDQLRYYDYYSGSSQKYLTTNRLFRDVNGFYHIVVRVDTTQSTASDRIRFYVNGVQETSFASSAYPSQNDNSSFVNWSGADNFVGTQTNNLSGAFLGSMSHVYLCDGQSYAPTVFGSTDSTTGEWKINTSPSITMGTNGFTILKDGNTVTDQSSNSNDFSIGSGTLTKTEDCPSNVFATLNPLDSDLTSNPFQYGNTKVSGQNPESAKYYCGLTLGMMGNGKYYFEAQLNVNNQGILGVCNLDASDNPTYLRQQNTFPGRYSSSWGYDLTDGYKFNNNNKTDYGGGTSWSANDYISFALDNTNGKMYIAKNGSWVSGGNPTNGTGGIDYSAIGDNNMFIVADNNNAGYNKFTFNFGNGSFDTTTLGTTYSPTVGDTSAKFKYNIIPTGYTALSTKGLNL